MYPVVVYHKIQSHSLGYLLNTFETVLSLLKFSTGLQSGFGITGLP